MPNSSRPSRHQVRHDRSAQAAAPRRSVLRAVQSRRTTRLASNQIPVNAPPQYRLQHRSKTSPVLADFVLTYS